MVGRVVVVGRVFELEGVTTVRVTVPLGLVLDDGLVVTVRDEVTVVVVVGVVVVEPFEVAGFVAEKSEVELGVLEVLVLLVLGVETPELAGWTVISAGLFKPEVSVRVSLTDGVVGFMGVAGVELLPPPLLKELPAPVVPPARLS